MDGSGPLWILNKSACLDPQSSGDRIENSPLTQRACYLQNKSGLLIPAVPTVQWWRAARCPTSKWSAGSWRRRSQCATDRRWLCDLKRNIQASVSRAAASRDTNTSCIVTGPESVLLFHFRASRHYNPKIPPLLTLEEVTDLLHHSEPENGFSPSSVCCQQKLCLSFRWCVNREKRLLSQLLRVYSNTVFYTSTTRVSEGNSAGGAAFFHTSRQLDELCREIKHSKGGKWTTWTCKSKTYDKIEQLKLNHETRRRKYSHIRCANEFKQFQINSGFIWLLFKLLSEFK